MHNTIHNMLRRMWLRLALSAGLVTVAIGAAAPQAHHIVALNGSNHCEPVVRDQ
jgi:hypothetical protein